MVGCSGGKNPSAEVLAKVGKATLTRGMLDDNMPGGLSADDSTKYARAYIRSWIDTKMVSQIAAREIDLAEIDRMTENYRNDLIMWEYSRLMFDRAVATGEQALPSEDSIRAYYEAHKRDFKLQRPMIRGVYLKVPDDARQLPALRKLYRSKTDADRDRLEKSEINGALHYDYFRDRWVDWEQIESRIPFDPGAQSADQFLSSHTYLDRSQGGFTYLLDIDDVLHTGETMPYETARERIIDRLTFKNQRQYDATIRRDLYERSLEDGKIRIYTDL